MPTAAANAHASANATSTPRTTSAATLRASPRYPRAIIAMCTSSESACALPKSAPADAATNERPEATLVSRETVRLLRAVYMSVTASRRWKRYRYAMPSTRMNIRGTRSARNAASSFDHEVVSVTQHDEGDRCRDPRDDQTGRGQALLREPELMTEPGAEGHDDGAGRDDVEHCGRHDDASEDRHEEPHALHEERHRELRCGRQREGRPVQAQQHGDVPHERGNDEQAGEADELDRAARAFGAGRARPRRPRRTSPAGAAPPRRRSSARRSRPSAACRCTRTRRGRLRAAAARWGLRLSAHAAIRSSASWCARRRHPARDPDAHEDHRRDRGDAGERRHEVADRRMLVVAESRSRRTTRCARTPRSAADRSAPRSGGTSPGRDRRARPHRMPCRVRAGRAVRARSSNRVRPTPSASRCAPAGPSSASASGTAA